jgi:hypothetical protein
MTMAWIHTFRDKHGDRAVYLCRTGPECQPETQIDCAGGELIGWVEMGRAMASVVDGRDVLWDEWRFTPSADEPPGEVRRAFARAREDARVYADELVEQRAAGLR